MVRKFGVALAAVALLTVSACGGNDVDRPSTAEVKTKLEAGKDLLSLGTQLKGVRTQLTTAGADTAPVDDILQCVAEALENSKMSNKALVALLDGDAKAKVAKSDEKDVTNAATAAVKCITDGTAKVQEAITAAAGATP